MFIKFNNITFSTDTTVSKGSKASAVKGSGPSKQTSSGSSGSSIEISHSGPDSQANDTNTIGTTTLGNGLVFRYNFFQNIQCSSKFRIFHDHQILVYSIFIKF